jgi:hypothetical protein
MPSVVLKKSIENIQIKFILKLFILDILVSLVQLELFIVIIRIWIGNKNVDI